MPKNGGKLPGASGTENEETEYVAYVSEQNLEADMTGEPVRHPQVEEIFDEFDGARYVVRVNQTH